MPPADNPRFGISTDAAAAFARAGSVAVTSEAISRMRDAAAALRAALRAPFPAPSSVNASEIAYRLTDFLRERIDGDGTEQVQGEVRDVKGEVVAVARRRIRPFWFDERALEWKANRAEGFFDYTFGIVARGGCEDELFEEDWADSLVLPWFSSNGMGAIRESSLAVLAGGRGATAKFTYRAWLASSETEPDTTSERAVVAADFGEAERDQDDAMAFAPELSRRLSANKNPPKKKPKRRRGIRFAS